MTSRGLRVTALVAVAGVFGAEKGTPLTTPVK